MRAIKNSITRNAVLAYEADTSKGIDTLERKLQGSLPYADMNDHSQTYWAPTWRDKLSILFGARVVVIVRGTDQPWMEVETKWPGSYGA